MVRAALQGRHTHKADGVNVNIWIRRGSYVARGYYQGQRFGLTLGKTEEAAEAALHKLLVEIAEGTFQRSSDRVHQPLPRGPVPQINLLELVNRYVGEVRQILGKKTMQTYLSRLAPVLAFWEGRNRKKRWPRVAALDREFVLQLKAYLATEHKTTRNGRPGGEPQSASARQIVNILDTLRGALSWARRPDIRLLPGDWASPLTPELVGEAAPKDPLRQNPIPLQDKLRLVAAMGRWELSHLIWPVLLPLRPEQVCGLLVEDVERDKKLFRFGTRLGGDDFTKAHTSFVIHYPPHLEPLLDACIRGRFSGPLLLTPKHFPRPIKHAQPGAVEEAFAAALRCATPKERLTANDRKKLFRKVLRRLGGASERVLAREFDKLTVVAGLQRVPVGQLRHAATQEMREARLPHLEVRYLTGHAVTDILTAYSSLDAEGAMAQYYQHIRPLLDAIVERGRALGIIGPEARPLAG